MPSTSRWPVAHRFIQDREKNSGRADGPTAISRVFSEQYLRNVSEMYGSLRNLLKNSSVHQKSSKSTEKAIENEVITDRQTDRPTEKVTYRVACPQLKAASV